MAPVVSLALSLLAISVRLWWFRITMIGIIVQITYRGKSRKKDRILCIRGTLFKTWTGIRLKRWGLEFVSKVGSVTLGARFLFITALSYCHLLRTRVPEIVLLLGTVHSQTTLGSVSGRHLPLIDLYRTWPTWSAIKVLQIWEVQVTISLGKQPFFSVRLCKC